MVRVFVEAALNAHLYGHIFAEELYTVLLHVLSGAVGHVLVEAPQQDGPDHDGDIKTQAGQEATALQCHVRRPDHQGLSRAVGQREEVVAGGRSGQTQRKSNRAVKHEAAVLPNAQMSICF